MANILILESEKRYRVLLRFILEGINHRVREIRDRDQLPDWTAEKAPDLLILGIHLEGSLDDWPVWQRSLPDVPVLFLFSGDPELKSAFLKAWAGTTAIKCLDQPVDPYPFLSMVKAMLTTPVVWRHGGQHAV